ncbi:hypothetical protein [Roseiconus lacunae]|uniref:Uncharacterized protein n=1 Tax=Roseiconus lacunae TaxID=2605694 RepID=A0ABT7PI73_9BACT|nr:hypothetical protein [Roseiconus lacunae]MDM4016198.1 hypothetical protein [Roseiconus lacunae]
MTCSTFWIGHATTEHSVVIDRVYGHHLTNQLFYARGSEGTGGLETLPSHPLQRATSEPSMSLERIWQERQDWVARMSLTDKTADHEPPLRQAYALQRHGQLSAEAFEVPFVDQDGNLNLVESICPAGRHRESGQSEILGYLEIAPASPNVAKLRQSLHKINNELSVASLGVQVVAMLVGRGIGIGDAKAVEACDNALAAVERIASDVSETLRELPGR